MISTIFISTLQQQLACQYQYRTEQNTYQVCQKQLRLQNTRIELEPIFTNPNSSSIKSVFQFSGVLNQIQINTKVQTNLSSFSMFALLTTKNIKNCQFNASEIEETQINVYGLAKNISSINMNFNRVLINFRFNNIHQYGFSLGQYVSGGIILSQFQDLSLLNEQQGKSSNSQIAMTDTVTGSLSIKNSTFKQYFNSQKQANLFGNKLVSRDESNSAEFSILDSQFDATVNNNININNASKPIYAFFQTIDESVYTSFSGMKGNIKGFYNQLTEFMDADDEFVKSEISVDLEKTEEVLLNINTNFNNTKLTFGTYNNNISASGKDISLLGERNIYYGVWISSSKISIQSDSFTFLMPTITNKVPTIANLVFNITVNATSTKVAGLSLSVQSNNQITIDNCTFAGSFNTTGSVYLLFETVKPKITIKNLTTQCDLSFMQDSYGLIKTVQNSIDIQGINSNISMNIIGNTIVTSSLMFDSVARSSTIKDVTGYYGGYITSQTCASSTCSISVSQGDIQLDTRSISGISIDSTTNKTFNGTQLYTYQVKSDYLYKLNGTKVTFTQKTLSSYSSYSILVNVLGDPKVVIDTEIQSVIICSSAQKLYLGGIAGVAGNTNYDIKNTKINVTFSSQASNDSAISDFFGILNTSASFTNVTSAGHLSGSANIGGLIAILETGTATMKTITIAGSYQSGKTYCGGVIGQIQSGATTSLDGLVMQGAKISSMSKSAGPVYGEHNGSSTQFNIISMDLQPSYYGGNCPVGSGSTSFSYNNCPAKSNDIEAEASDFSLTTTISATSYHSSMTIHHVFENDRDLNNSKLLLSLSNMRGQSENRSLFGVKTSYDNVRIIIQNNPDIKFNSDSYCFGILQAIIDDTTVSVSNVYIQSPMNGNNYAHAGGLCSIFASNATVENITTNISDMNFYFGTSFIHNVSAANPLFKNISVNATTHGSGNQTGLFYNISSSTDTVTVQTGTVIVASNGTILRGAVAFYVPYGVNTTINNISFTLQGNKSSSTYSPTMYPAFLFIQINAPLVMDNCTVKSNVNLTMTGSIISNTSSSYSQTYTNCNFTGYLGVYSSSSYSTYDVGLIDGKITSGTRTINNCKVFDQTVLGYGNVGGLIGYVYGSYAKVYINNTQVNVSLILNGTSSSAHAGGFIGYKYSSSSTVEITNSLYNDMNGVGGQCDTMTSGYDYSSSSNIQCYPQMKNVSISSSPQFSSSYFYSYHYTDISAGCYWPAYDGSDDWNYTTFTISSYSDYCYSADDYDTLTTFFNPSFTPALVKNITLKGKISAYSSYAANIALFHKNNPSQETTYQNIQLLNTFTQKTSYYSYSSDHFNTSGIVYMLNGNNNVNFINCLNNQTINRTDSYHSHSASSAFYHNNSLSSGKKVTLKDCSSNIQVTGTYSSYTDVYNVSYNPGDLSFSFIFSYCCHLTSTDHLVYCLAVLYHCYNNHDNQPT